MVMPYLLEKGPAMTYLEEFLNGDLVTMVGSLDALRTNPNQSLFGLGGVFPDDVDLEHRLRTNWFGQQATKNAAGEWQYAPQPALDKDDPRPTGYWIGYYGSVESILRETLIRAVEVSLGIEHLQPVPLRHGVLSPPRRWPIEMFWKCSNPWYEGWVTWRRQRLGGSVPVSGAGPQIETGQVTVVLASPGDNRNRLIHDSTAPPNPWGPDMVNPARASTDQGMWVVSHRRHRPHVQQRTFVVKPGTPVNDVLVLARQRYAKVFGAPTAGPVWEFPQIGTLWAGSVTGAGKPEIVVVAPPYVDGGVASSAPAPAPP